MPATTTNAEHLKIDLEAGEPGGGLVASLLGLPGAPPLRLEAKGDGPLRDWRGHLTAAAGGVAGIDADVRLSGKDPLRVAVDGSADVQGLLPPNLAPLTAGGVALRGDGRCPLRADHGEQPRRVDRGGQPAG